MVAYGFFTITNPMAGIDTSPISLRALLAAVLRDVAAAQNQSNYYSARVLADRYRDDELLRMFPVPNAFLGELEITLQFMVAGTGDGNIGIEDDYIPQARLLFQKETLLPYLRAIVTKSGQLITSFLDTVANLADDEMVQKIDALQKGVLSAQFTDYLLNALLGKLLDNETTVVKDWQTFLPDEAAKLLMQVIGKAFLNNKEFDFVFAKGKQARTDITPKFINIVRNEMKQVKLPKYTSDNKEEIKSIMVYVVRPDVGPLDKGSQNSFVDPINTSFISTITIKVDMRNYKWVIDMKNRSADTLLPVNN